MSSRASYLELVEAIDNFPYNDGVSDAYYRFVLPQHDTPYGLLHLGAVLSMPWTKSFHVNHEEKRIFVLPNLAGEDPSEAVTTAFAELINTAIDQNAFKCIGRRHSELFLLPDLPYRVVVERYACSVLGVATRGAHLTAYTTSNSEMKIWVPRRSQNVGTWKGKLDSTVAGGVAADETPYENIVREADEEASLPSELIHSRIKEVGVLTYIGRTTQGENGWEGGMVIPDIVSVFDMELPEDVIPMPRDEEVKEFYLMTVDQVKNAMLNKEFKPNSAVIMLDFFIRHGIVTMANEPDYVEIVQRMHRQLNKRVDTVDDGSGSDEDWSRLIHAWQDSRL